MKLKLAEDGSIMLIVDPRKSTTNWVTRTEKGQFLGVPHNNKVEKIDISLGGSLKLNENEIQNKR
ncbi:MAG: hypothetical protein WA125_15120 [Desulfosporosinus sp.]